MSQPVEPIAATELGATMRAANLSSHTVSMRTRARLETATARGRLVRLSRGTPVLDVDGALLGAPANETSADATVADVRRGRDAVAVVFGLGAGHAVRDLRQRTDATLVVFEPDVGLLCTLLEAGPLDLGDITITSDLDDLAALWPGLARDNPAATVVVTPGYAEAFPAELASLTEAVRALAADVSLFENTRAIRYRSWIGHVLENLECIPTAGPLGAIEGAWSGVPVFVVGAGPSLAANVGLLREASKKGIVIAVDVAAKVLARHGVEPHVIVSLEALDLSVHVAALPFIDRVVRAVSLTAHPAMIRTGQGPLLGFVEGLPALAPLASLLASRPVSVGGSVSTVALSIAERLGCSPIVLVGQDLAYTGGRTHAEGTAFERSRAVVDAASGRIHYAWCEAAEAVRAGSHLGPPQRFEQLFEVGAWGGEGVVGSTSAFNGYRSWFESMAEGLAQAKPGLSLVNATEGGSRIRGYAERRLGDLLAELPELDAARLDVAGRVRAASGRVAAAHVTEWLDRQISGAARAARAAQALERGAAKVLARMHRTDVSGVQGALDGLDRLEAQMRAVARDEPLVAAWADGDAHDAVVGERAREEHADAAAEAACSLEAEQKLAAALAVGARDLGVALGRARERMRALGGSRADVSNTQKKERTVSCRSS